LQERKRERERKSEERCNDFGAKIEDYFHRRDSRSNHRDRKQELSRLKSLVDRVYIYDNCRLCSAMSHLCSEPCSITDHSCDSLQSVLQSVRFERSIREIMQKMYTTFWGKERRMLV